MRLKITAVLLGLLACITISRAAQREEPKPYDAYFEPFHPLKAPSPKRHLLRANDRLAICGDSITEQKMYSRIMETYLTVCVPELNVSVRQFGWSGETAKGFLARMTNDCLRFQPTIATTCYGMNDHGYRPYEDSIGAAYQSNSMAIDEGFKSHKCRLVEGSAGCVGKKAWFSPKNATLLDLNLNLCQLRNIGLQLAKHERVAFADVFWPMLVEAHEAQLQYGTNYELCGKDGIHPNWAGHLVMAYAFLHEFGLDGDIGTFTVDLKSKKAKVSSGHELLGFKDGALTVRSHRYPFCIGDGDPAKSDNLHSGTMLVPFDRELNRLMLVAKRPQAKAYKVTWGGQTHEFSAEELKKGVNLAEAFLVNPFSEQFKKVDEAVAAKQAFETEEVKKLMHGDAGKKDMEGTVAKAEEKRAALVEAVKEAFVPVTHTVTIVPAED